MPAPLSLSVTVTLSIRVLSPGSMATAAPPLPEVFPTAVTFSTVTNESMTGAGAASTPPPCPDPASLS